MLGCSGWSGSPESRGCQTNVIGPAGSLGCAWGFTPDEALANAQLIAAANPKAILELLDKLDAVTKERDRLRGMINIIPARP